MQKLAKVWGVSYTFLMKYFIQKLENGLSSFDKYFRSKLPINMKNT